MMPLSAQLAWRQLRRNPIRTFWTLAAIGLATALTTCVCSFVVSGQAMLVASFGENYGQYDKAYSATLVMPAAFLALVIALMAIVVISNVFRVSGRERMAEFGTLKCVGATGAQIRTTMLWEAGLLALVGIPLGLVLGEGLAAAGLGVANHFFDELNALTQVMVKKMTFEAHFIFSWQALLVSAGLSFVTVLFSAWLPARKAARQAAIDSVRGHGETKVRVRQRTTRGDRWIEKVFGPEGLLAHKTLRRNARTFRATMLALGVAVILFVFLGFMVQQAAQLNALLSPKTPYTVTADYQSARAKTTDGSERYVAPITSSEAEAITAKLTAYDGGTTVYGFGNDYGTYTTQLETATLSPEIVEYYEWSGQAQSEVAVEYIVLDRAHYEALCEDLGIAVGGNILINENTLNLKGHATDVPFFAEVPQALTLTMQDGTSEVFSIDGVLSGDAIPSELVYPNTNPLRLIVPEGTVRNYSWEATPTDTEGFIGYARDVLAEVYPTSAEDAYMVDGYSVRVYETQDYSKVMNLVIVLAVIFIVCFCVLLMLIGFTNVVSTLSTNVLMRSGEFAVLRSVGMTPEGLVKMLSFESLLCTLRAIAWGLPIGLVMTYLVHLPLVAMFPVPYTLPWQTALGASAGMFFVTLAITRLAARKLYRQNIIETIRATQRFY